jgi:hypothetical protein
MSFMFSALDENEKSIVVSAMEEKATILMVQARGMKRTVVNGRSALRERIFPIGLAEFVRAYSNSLYCFTSRL